MTTIPNQKPLTVEEAQRQVLTSVTRLSSLKKPLAEAADFFLAKEIVSDQDVPAYDRSMMDGYAVRAEDIQSARQGHPATLQVIEEIPAGNLPQRVVEKGTASRIMTGAPVPPGADAVVRVEDTRKFSAEGKELVEILRAVNLGEAIGLRGEDLLKGQRVIAKGSRIGPAELGLLATFGYSEVSVISRPQVAILSTGSEVLEVAEAAEMGKLRDSNSWMLSGQVMEAGGEPRRLGIVHDDVALIAERLSEAIEESDALVTSGGVSMGDYDFMLEVFDRLGAEVRFWKVAVRPGMPFLYGTCRDKPVFALPGNPASAFVISWLFLMPAVRQMAGSLSALPSRLRAVTTTAVRSKPIPHTRYLRALLRHEQSRLRVQIDAAQSSGILSNIAQNNCLVVVPGGAGYREGDEVEVEVYRDWTR